MLHKSFKPAKCKTSLKLATSRIKLMKNKKGVQMNQMKRELAQLLESGQDRTARIRVEHLIREEKMVAAYDLIEIYCELIAARLPIIESQKNCPIDLKEAITSVIFASPRCADIPELLQIRKHFTAKYGKEFISAALELRPDCGVGRMLVEKLSAIAPDGQTKLKVLNAIAEEHNIKWDPKSFEEKELKPADDLLNGPSTFEKASTMHAETPKIQVPNVQAPSSHDRHDRPLNFPEQNTRSSLGTQNSSSTDTGGIKTTSAATHPDLRSYGKGTESMEVRHSFAGDGNAFSLGRQNWNMEFKDATSAAQAAAESAERASMAARAAAELSSRGNITRQYPTESQKSHERPANYAASKLPGEHFAKVPVSNSFHDKNSELQNEQIDRDEHDNLTGSGERFHRDGHGNTKRSSHSASLRSSEASIDDGTFVNSVQKTYGYSEKSSFEETNKAEKGALSSEMNMNKQSVESGIQNVSGWQDGFKSENLDYFGEPRIEKQFSTSSSRSHSSTSTDDYNVSNSNHQKFRNDAAKNPFVGIDQGSINRDTVKMGSDDDDAVAFDEYDFDGDSHSFDIEPKYDEGESTSYISSPGRNSLTFPSTTADTWSPRRNTIISPEISTSHSHFSAERQSSPLFSESLGKSVDPSESDNVVPVTSYDSDGPKFDSEDELEKSTDSGTKDSSIFSHKQNVFSLDPEPTQGDDYGLTGSAFPKKRNSGSDKRPWLGSSSSDDLDSVEVRLRNNPVTVLNAESTKKFGSGESLANNPSPRFGNSQSELNDIDTDELVNQSSPESANNLNFGTLTGGFRNKGYMHPPYTESSSGDASSLSKKAAEESSTVIEQTASPSLRSSLSSSMNKNADKKSSFSTSITSSDSDTDDSGEDFPQQTSSRRQDPYVQKSSKEVNMKSSFRPPVTTYFDLDNDDSKEDIPKRTFPNRGQLGSGFSRRTKASPSSSETSSYSKVRVGSEESASPNSSNESYERKPTRSYYGAETPTKLKSQMGNPGQLASEEQPSSAKQAASMGMTVSKISFRSDEQPSSAKQAATKAIPGSKISSRSDERPSSAKQPSSKAMPASKISSREESFNSSEVERPSSPLRDTGASGSLQYPKTSSLSGEPPTRENSAKRASHVHPKLPDYDSLAAHLQSLRTNRH